MLTFSHVDGISVKVVGGFQPVVSFPKKASGGQVNLLSSPDESLSKDLISWPGEYDIGGIAIRGIGQEEGQKVSYTVEIDHIRIAFLSSPLTLWADEDLERLGDVQVLVLPAQDVKLCQKLIDDIDPRVLILTPSLEGALSPEVLKAAGAANAEHVTEYKLKGSLPQEGREVVVFG